MLTDNGNSREYLAWRVLCRHPNQRTDARQRDHEAVQNKMRECLQTGRRRPAVSHESLVYKHPHFVT